MKPRITVENDGSGIWRVRVNGYLKRNCFTKWGAIWIAKRIRNRIQCIEID